MTKKYDADKTRAICKPDNTLIIFSYFLLLHGNNGYTNAPQCYVTRYTDCIFRISKKPPPQKIQNAAQRDRICLFIKFTSVLIIRLTKFNVLCLHHSTYWFI